MVDFFEKFIHSFIHSFVRSFVVVVDQYWLLIKSRVAPSIMNQLPSLFVWWKKRRKHELTIILICFCLWLLWWLCVDDWHCRAPLASSSSSSSRKVSVSLWDFHRDSGYETSHQFFVTDNTIVVIVFDMSLPIAAARLHFWLTSVRLLVCSWCCFDRCVLVLPWRRCCCLARTPTWWVHKKPLRCAPKSLLTCTLLVHHVLFRLIVFALPSQRCII